MGTEIERKFLIRSDAWRSPPTGAPAGIRYRQGYLASGAGVTARVRVGGNKGFITVKGKTVGISRPEFEYEIPADDANQMIDTLCAGVVEKVRYEIPAPDGVTWELDEFLGDNAGLLLAEVELDSESQPFDKPAWLGDEVTGDQRYYNAYLAKYPYQTWGSPEQRVEDGR